MSSYRTFFLLQKEDYITIEKRIRDSSIVGNNTIRNKNQKLSIPRRLFHKSHIVLLSCINGCTLASQSSYSSFFFHKRFLHLNNILLQRGS